MRIGVPTEIKADEYRVALTPAGARELTARGHEVIVQAGAGEGSAIADSDYVAQGARVVPVAASAYSLADLVVKVKEPQPAELSLLGPGQTLFTYLHLAPAPELTRGLVESGATCIAYETVVDPDGRLPLLAPMSEVAGKIAAQAGAFVVERAVGGRSRDKDHDSIGRDPGKAAVRYGREVVLDFLAQRVPPERRPLNEVSDLPGAPGEGLFQSLGEMVAQASVRENTEDHEQQREPARVPRDQAKLQRAGVHASSSSVRQ